MFTHLRAAVGAAFLALVLSACGSHAKVEHSQLADDLHTDVSQLAAAAQTGVYVVGTIATLGSFEWDVAPLKTHAAVVLHHAAVALKLGHITVEQAEKIQADVDHAHDLLQKALAACAQDDHTGKCTKDEASARALLDQARAALAVIK